MRTNLSAISVMNDSIYVGDNVGSVSIWTFNEKKGTLTYEDITRQATAYLPPLNNVKKIESKTGVVAALTEDGKITTYALNSAKKVVGNVKWELEDKLENFILIPT